MELPPGKPLTNASVRSGGPANRARLNAEVKEVSVTSLGDEARTDAGVAPGFTLVRLRHQAPHALRNLYLLQGSRQPGRAKEPRRPTITASVGGKLLRRRGMGLLQFLVREPDACQVSRKALGQIFSKKLRDSTNELF